MFKKKKSLFMSRSNIKASLFYVLSMIGSNIVSIRWSSIKVFILGDKR